MEVEAAPTLIACVRSARIFDCGSKGVLSAGICVDERDVGGNGGVVEVGGGVGVFALAEL